MYKTGLLGYPIDHSLSPAMHNAAYEELGLDWHYELYPCADQAALEATVAAARGGANDFLGLNVTSPWKRQAAALASHKSRIVGLTGGANVLSFVGNASNGFAGVSADNTDGCGVVAALTAMLPADNAEVGKAAMADGDSATPLGGAQNDATNEATAKGRTLAGANVVICGSGPVAMAALYELALLPVASVCLLSRDAQAASQAAAALIRRLGEERYRDLANRLQGTIMSQMNLAAQKMTQAASQLPPLPKTTALGYESAAEVLAVADVLIDATPTGMQSGAPTLVPAQALHPGLVVLDSVYGHGTSDLVAAARAAGCAAADGLEMLVEQAALSIEHWAATLGLKLTAPRDIMRAACA